MPKKSMDSYGSQRGILIVCPGDPIKQHNNRVQLTTAVPMTRNVMRQKIHSLPLTNPIAYAIIYACIVFDIRRA